MNTTKKAVVISGTSVDKLKLLKKEYMLKNKKHITFDTIVSKLLLKAKLDDID